MRHIWGKYTYTVGQIPRNSLKFKNFSDLVNYL